MGGSTTWWARVGACVLAVASIASVPVAAAEEPAALFDLSISDIAVPEEVLVGEPIVVTVTVHNAGPGVADAPVLAGTWEATNLRFRGAAGAGVECDDSVFAHCTLDPLASGESGVVQVTVQPRRPGPVAVWWGIERGPGESNYENNEAPGMVWDAGGEAQTADVRVHAEGPTAGVIGSPQDLTFDVENLGPAVASGTELTVSWPVGVTIADMTPPVGSACQTSLTELACVLRDLPATSTDQLRVTLVPHAAGSLVVDASLDSLDDRTPGNDEADVTIPITAPADLAVELDAEPWVPEGEPTAVTLRGRNDGPAVATDVTMSLTWSPSPTWEPETSVVIEDAGGLSCAIEANELTCDAGDVPSGWSGEVALTLVSDEVPELELTALIASPDDVDLDDNELHRVVAVPAAPDPCCDTFDLSIVDVELPEIFEVGEIAVIDVTVYNAGPATAPAAGVGGDWDPRHIRRIGVGGAATECDTPLPECVTGPIGAGETAMVHLVVEPLRPGPANGGFGVSSFSGESRLTNNHRRAPFVVEGEVLTANTWVTVTPAEGPGAMYQPVERTITVGNDGPHPADAIDVQIDWAGLDLDLTAPAGARCESVGDTGHRCRLPEIPAGGELVIPATFTPVSDGPEWIEVAIDYLDETDTSDDSASTVIDIPWTQEPTVPTETTAVPHDRSILVTWEEPEWDGGAPITEYVAVAQPGGHTCSADGDDRDCVIEGLVNGTSYEVTVRAINWQQLGPFSAAVVAVPRTVPGAPRQVEAVARDGAATVRWLAPRRDGGAPITAYRVTSNSGTHRCRTDGELQCRVRGLTNGTTYAFTVEARNEAGWGPASVPSADVVPRAPRRR